MSPEVRPTGTRFLENLAYLVPGYRGYKDKERRREEDSRLRSLLLGRLSEIRGILVDILAGAAEDPDSVETEPLDDRVESIGFLSDTIRYAPYGFSGFFDAGEVAENSLDRILEVDLLLFEDLDAIEQIVLKTELIGTDQSSMDVFLVHLDESTSRFEHHLILRDKILGNA